MFESISKKQVVVLIGALMLVLCSAISAAYSVHLTRHYVGKLSELEQEQSALQVEWEKLLIEINMLAAYGRVELTALKELDMQAPTSAQLRVIEIKGKSH